MVLIGRSAEIRALLRGDCHTHSDWSDGGSPIEEMARAARDLGHEYIVLTDHSPRLKVANGLTAERLRTQLDLVAEINERLAPFRILTGIEVDILDDGSLDQTDELLARLDVVVASVHSKLRMESAPMTPRMIAAVQQPPRRHPRPLHRPHGHRQGPPPVRLRRRGRVRRRRRVRHRGRDQLPARAPRPAQGPAAQGGRRRLQVSIDTDAHAPGQLEWQPYGCVRAADCGVPDESIVNAWPADRLLEWTASHNV